MIEERQTKARRRDFVAIFESHSSNCSVWGLKKDFESGPTTVCFVSVIASCSDLLSTWLDQLLYNSTES